MDGTEAEGVVGRERSYLQESDWRCGGGTVKEFAPYSLCMSVKRRSSWRGMGGHVDIEEIGKY